MLFFKRYYVQILSNTDVHIEIKLNNTFDRRLASLDPPIRFENFHISKENAIIVTRDLKIVDLRTSYKQIANDLIKRVLLIFNLNDISESTIEHWQTKLLERKF